MLSQYTVLAPATRRGQASSARNSGRSAGHLHLSQLSYHRIIPPLIAVALEYAVGSMTYTSKNTQIISCACSCTTQLSQYSRLASKHSVSEQ